jgi:hypothetical protein
MPWDEWSSQVLFLGLKPAQAGFFVAQWCRRLVESQDTQRFGPSMFHGKDTAVQSPVAFLLHQEAVERTQKQ